MNYYSEVNSNLLLLTKFNRNTLHVIFFLILPIEIQSSSRQVCTKINIQKRKQKTLPFPIFCKQHLHHIPIYIKNFTLYFLVYFTYPNMLTRFNCCCKRTSLQAKWLVSLTLIFSRIRLSNKRKVLTK